MRDPTYVQEEIERDPVWKLAFWMSEYDNDSAPVGWGRYISLARGMLNAFDVQPKDLQKEREA